MTNRPINSKSAAELMMAELILSMSHPDGPLGRLRDVERERGHQIIPIDAPLAFCFSSADFFDTLLTRDGNEIRIVLINSHHPRQGAFGRLVRGIHKAGLIPVVIAPIGPFMPVILKHWGWKMTTSGIGFERTDEWRPG